MDSFNQTMAAIGDVIWHQNVLFTLLAVGVLFTVWSGFCQYRALTHGPAVLTGRYDDKNDKGAISHFQALSTVLSATVGLGNIAGVALAVALGGPGAVFWMWVIGIIGMAIKLTEVTLSMLYRNIDDPENPHGGPMWVVSRGLAEIKPSLGWLGKTIGAIFCVTLLISTITGGNMFQAWSVGEITNSYFGVPTYISGIILAGLVGMVIIGGVKRIGRVAAALVPLMVMVYLISSLIVIGANWQVVPETLVLIVVSAFNPQEAAGAFIGGGMGMALLIGLQRALFSSEAGQGSAPIAYAAAKTREPVREGVVGAMGPFIDTIVVCTLTAMVILTTGTWNRDAEARYDVVPEITEVGVEREGRLWSLGTSPLPERETHEEWTGNETVFMVVRGSENPATGNVYHRIYGEMFERNDQWHVTWSDVRSEERPEHTDMGVYVSYAGATLTARAFDDVIPGLGMWMVTVAVWLFAISTMIAWSYYGEQGVIFLAGQKAVLPYKFIFCALIIVATLGLITTDEEINNFSTIGTGVMLWANIPIMLFFGHKAMRAYKDYIRRLKSGEIKPSDNPPSFKDVFITGKDVDR